MKKKLLFLILLLLLVVGCGAKKEKYGVVSTLEQKEEEVKNSPEEEKDDDKGTGTVINKGMYTYEGLSFNLPSEFSKKTDNFYYINNDEETISITFGVTTSVEDSLKDYLSNDSYRFPDMNTLEILKINNVEWYKLNGEYGDIVLYYCKVENKIYYIVINPLLSTVNRIEEIEGVLEKSLVIEGL